MENFNIKKKKREIWGFPDGSVVKNPPCNIGDADLIPGWGTRIPHTAEQLNCNSWAHAYN